MLRRRHQRRPPSPVSPDVGRHNSSSFTPFISSGRCYAYRIEAQDQVLQEQPVVQEEPEIVEEEEEHNVEEGVVGQVNDEDAEDDEEDDEDNNQSKIQDQQEECRGEEKMSTENKAGVGDAEATEGPSCS